MVAGASSSLMVVVRTTVRTRRASSTRSRADREAAAPSSDPGSPSCGAGYHVSSVVPSRVIVARPTPHAVLVSMASTLRGGGVGGEAQGRGVSHRSGQKTPISVAIERSSGKEMPTTEW